MPLAPLGYATASSHHITALGKTIKYITLKSNEW
jgi:hypothetical protein